MEIDHRIVYGDTGKLRTILFFQKSARTEKAILDAITMKMNIIPALEYLRDVGFEMSERKYFSHRKKSLKNQTRMNLLTAKYFQEQYLKLDRLDLIENLMWDN